MTDQHRRNILLNVARCINPANSDQEISTAFVEALPDANAVEIKAAMHTVANEYLAKSRSLWRHFFVRSAAR